MNLVFAFLANDAGHLQDGRLCVFGAGVDVIKSNVFPTAQVSFSLVAMMRLMPDEPTVGHFFDLEVDAATGRKQKLSEREPVNTSRNKLLPDKPSGAYIVVSILMAFEEPGEYVFHLSVDGTTRCSIPLYVVQGEAHE
jgi:hypothetical protein